VHPSKDDGAARRQKKGDLLHNVEVRGHTGDSEKIGLKGRNQGLPVGSSRKVYDRNVMAGLFQDSTEVHQAGGGVRGIVVR